MLFPATLATIAISLASLSEALSFHAPYSQDSVDLDTPNRFLANAGPFNEAIGYGIPTDTPEDCKIDQAHLFMREGARFPLKGQVEDYIELLNTLKNTSIAVPSGPLAFVADYEPLNFNATKYGRDTSFDGIYSGSNEVHKLGAILRARYNHLVDESSTTPLFAAAAQKVYDTAQIFGDSFFFGGRAGDYKVFVFDEEVEASANTLTSAYSCPAYDDDANDDLVDSSTLDFYQWEADRLNRVSPGFNLTDDDVYVMFSYCAFELDAYGSSKFCDALSRNFLIGNAYTSDLNYFYSYGPGNNFSTVGGGLYVNATATMLKQGPEVAPALTFSFTHETILLNYITALGLLGDQTTLDVNSVDFNRYFHSSQTIPMGGRVITERLSCTNHTSGKDESYVRILLNNKVTPVPGCNSGPGYSCPLDDYLDYVSNKTVRFADACHLNSSSPQDLSFYWDWKTANYSTKYTFDF
ncbi:hypothetical protein PMKS-000894 [Pichia membranifaciens]|uniref:Uncharacterized protein n=1 Tax=Pichia membranifaciens TaxID=4926 RepID=A0A1Q2YCX6_9ASCO|nr:hypothetical protein PMKS-000894 [Pichia membranifaciens]